MSHHGSGPFDDDGLTPDQRASRNKLMRELLDTTGFRGALGDFPAGQIKPSDEGAIQFAIGEEKGKVILDFGTPVHWVALTPQEAAGLASALLKRAREAARKTGETVSFMIG